MIVLSANGVAMAFGESTLFSDLNFEIGNEDKVGLVGVNGCGKTTLFKILNREISPENGAINKMADVKIGYMEQYVIRDSNTTMYDEALTIFSDLIKAEEELEALHNQIDNGDHSELTLSKQMHLSEQFERDGGLTYKARTASALIGLGFTEDELELPVSVLSGGQKSKVQLVKLLLSKANLLLLDEPTNHLDIAAVEWLEKFLTEYKGAYIVISHDRYFLDKVTSRTLELENGHITAYKGGYSSYMEKKEENRVIQQKHYEQTMGEIKRIEGIVEQQKRWGQEHNFITAAHKQKSADKLKETLDKPEELPDAIKFAFDCKESGGNDVFVAKNLALSFDGKKIFSNVNLDIKKNTRVFLLGANGCGKTSLFKILIGQYEANFGEYKFGSRIEAGYYDQAQTDLDYTKTVIDEVWDNNLKMNQTQIRTALASFLFKGDDVFKNVGKLSGGEKARVSLLKLMLTGANFLLLDEPTNHLDIHSREALENALLGYNGTLFIISHDRYLINKLADKIYYLDESGITEFDGGYDDYIENQVKAQQIQVEKAKADKKPNSYKQKKEEESRQRKLRGRITRLEEQIGELESEVEEKTVLLSTPEISTDYEQALSLSNEIADIKQQLDQLMEEWATACEEME